jgi:hypothetical protein
MRFTELLPGVELKLWINLNIKKSERNSKPTPFFWIKKQYFDEEIWTIAVAKRPRLLVKIDI